MNKNKAFLDEELNKEIEEIISSIVRDVHYEKTYPAHSAYYQLDFKAFRKRLKKVFDKQNHKISKLLKEIIGCEYPKIGKDEEWRIGYNKRRNEIKEIISSSPFKLNI